MRKLKIETMAVLPGPWSSPLPVEKVSVWLAPTPRYQSQYLLPGFTRNTLSLERHIPTACIEHEQGFRRGYSKRRYHLLRSAPLHGRLSARVWIIKQLWTRF